MSSIRMTVVYSAQKVIDDKFIGQAVMTWEDRLGSQPKKFTFDTPFATREEATADAKARLIDAFTTGTVRSY